MSNRAKTARKNLKARQADYDNNGLSPMRGFVRPGSQNAHKQGAGGDTKKKGR